MAYNPKYNEQHYKYRTEKFKRIGVDFEKEYVENVLKPAAEKAGEPVNTFIKNAIAMRIEEKFPELARIADEFERVPIDEGC